MWGVVKGSQYPNFTRGLTHSWRAHLSPTALLRSIHHQRVQTTRSLTGGSAMGNRTINQLRRNLAPSEAKMGRDNTKSTNLAATQRKPRGVLEFPKKRTRQGENGRPAVT